MECIIRHTFSQTTFTHDKQKRMYKLPFQSLPIESQQLWSYMQFARTTVVQIFDSHQEHHPEELASLQKAEG